MVATTVLKKVFGSRNERALRSANRLVKKILQLEPAMQALSDDELKAKTEAFKARLEKGATLNDILVEAFAVVREASVRTTELRHFDVQMVGGITLHLGRVAEMKTGEGKTLVATLPLYLHALTGNGAHLITVNDYLAQRDAKEMGPIYEFLGMRVGVIIQGLENDARKAAYDADITYGTNNEFGFDYLRDNMVFSMDDKVQRSRNFAVVDEVDSILIDEARTPLIISGETEDNSSLYQKLKTIVPKLEKGNRNPEDESETGDFYLDEKSKQAFLTEQGHQTLEKELIAADIIKENESLYSPGNVLTMHYLNASLRAYTLFEIDVDYMVKDNQVMIVDEHTGRAMPGRRWSDGLHQAIEAKEGLEVQNENQTMASITFQNFFRLYNCLSGMTGTADTEAYELHEIYKLEVVVIPTHKPMIRKDHPDMVYGTILEKFAGVVEAVKECQEKKQPALIGTASIEASELLSKMLKDTKVDHQVLNAKQHEREAGIIAQAGAPGMVTIATNMAGRGTDIILGGNWQAEIEGLPEDQRSKEAIAHIKSEWQKRHDAVIDAGGLIIIGSERHESRRIDNQLRGRSGRQGDPGASRFYLSLEDNLIRIFAGERMMLMMQKLGFKDGMAIESRMVSRSIAKAQKKVETHNFDIRKQLLEYDNVANDQRKVVYEQRDAILVTEDCSEMIERIFAEAIKNTVHQYMPDGTMEEQWDVSGLMNELKSEFNYSATIKDWLEDDNHDESTVKKKLQEAILQVYKDKIEPLDTAGVSQYQRAVILSSYDSHWREHITQLDHLRSTINLRGYAQKDPKQEYKRESFEQFTQMIARFKSEVASTLARVQITDPSQANATNTYAGATSVNYVHQELDGMGNSVDNYAKGNGQSVAKVGRNDPCPCGSGKKYKQCHGKIN